MKADPKMVVVTWLDSVGLDDGGWMDADAVADSLGEDTMRHESTGYLVGESKASIALAGSRNLGDETTDRNTKLGNVLVIPRAAVVEMRELSLNTKRRPKASLPDVPERP